MKILCVFGEHNYGNPERGLSYEYANFLPALRNLGHDVVHFDSWNKDRYQDFAGLNRALVETVLDERPEVILCVLMTYEIWIDSLEELRRRLPVVIVHWGTDDSWKYEMFSRWVAPAFDIYVTTSHEAYALAKKDGHTNFVCSQWAANSKELHPPIKSEACRYAVTFVGSAYGNRPTWIANLRKRGIEITCFGYGWESGPIPAEEIPKIIRNSVISLNFGDSGIVMRGLLPTRNRQIKARVFEVPGAGGFLITETAPELEKLYIPDEEVVTFDGIAELEQKINFYLSNPEQRDDIASRGYQRTKDEHTYEHRFVTILTLASELRSSIKCNVSPSIPDGSMTFEKAASRHCAGFALRLLRSAMVGFFALFFGRKRGARAARRFVYEISWRVCRDKTYRSAGIPGRIFYRES